MAEQLACFLTPITGNAIDGYEWVISSELDAANVSFSGAINRLPNGEKIISTKDYEHSGDPEVIVTAGLTVVYATGDEINIAALETKIEYHLFWFTFTDPEANDTVAEPLDLNIVSDLTTLRDFLASHTSKSNDQITQWFGNKFDVTKAQAVDKATSEDRLWLVNKMMAAMRRWADAKTEFEALA